MAVLRLRSFWGVLFIALGFLWFSERKSKLSPRVEVSYAEREKTPLSAKANRNQSQAHSVSSQNHTKEKKLELKSNSTRSEFVGNETKSNGILPPKVEDVYRDVQLNPHTPSNRVLALAESIGEAFENLKGNSDKAKGLFSDLETCVLGTSVALSARALCLDSAQRVAMDFEELKESYVDLEKMASGSVRVLMRSLGRRLD